MKPKKQKYDPRSGGGGHRGGSGEHRGGGGGARDSRR